MEHVADQLAERHLQYQHGLSQVALVRYEPTNDRHMYLVMQDLIAGLMLAERAILGRAFIGAVEQRLEERGTVFTMMVALIPSHPEVVFVLGSFAESASFSRDMLLRSFYSLYRAPVAHYGRSRCFIVVDQKRTSYKAGLAEQQGTLRAEDYEAGQKVFGKLRFSEIELMV